MIKDVFLEYNPYLPSMKILFDGKEISEYSQLIRFMNEPIWEFNEDFFNTIYSEIRENYRIVFSGIEFDYEVLNLFAQECAFCESVQFEPLKTNLLTTQQRLGELNQYVKKNKIYSFTKQYIRCAFISNNSKKRKYVEEIEIENLFCKVVISTYILESKIDTIINQNDYVFVDTEGIDMEKCKSINQCGNKFIILMDHDDSKKNIYQTMNIITYNSSDDIVEDIFSLMLYCVLPYSIGKCLSGLDTSELDDEMLQRIVGINEVLRLESVQCVELGKSIPILITDMDGKRTNEDLVYRVIDEKVISCNGLNITGKQVGDTILEIYRKGEKYPLIRKKFSVIIRNRVKKIVLDYDSILLGEDDTFLLKYETYPHDADNLSDICWKTTDSNVVEIDKYGRVHALRGGSCDVICVIGNVSARCNCHVKPYLESLNVTDVNGGKMILETGEEKKLEIELTPENALDDKLVIKSSNYDVVNVVGNKIIGKKRGITDITISNGRIEQVIQVKVVKKIGLFKI